MPVTLWWASPQKQDEELVYDGFLRMDLPAGTSIIGITDDALIVCATQDVETLELSINESMWQKKRWLNNTGLEMTLKKTDSLLVMSRRSFRYPKIVLGGREGAWSRRIKDLGIQLHQRLSFGENLQFAMTKAIQFGVNLTRLLPFNWLVGEVLLLAMPKKDGWGGLADGLRAMEVVLSR